MKTMTFEQFLSETKKDSTGFSFTGKDQVKIQEYKMVMAQRSYDDKDETIMFWTIARKKRNDNWVGSISVEKSDAFSRNCDLNSSRRSRFYETNEAFDKAIKAVWKKADKYIINEF